MSKKTWLYLLPFIIFLMGAVFLFRGSTPIPPSSNP
jgi:cytochrome c biogenesis protein CcmG/thiol:disulfide interchange protein DsbE